MATITYRVVQENPGFSVINTVTGESLRITNANYGQYKVNKAYCALVAAKKAGDTSNVLVELPEPLEKNPSATKTTETTKVKKESKRSTETTTGSAVANNNTDSTIATIHNSVMNKPENLMISDLKWKFLTRSIVRGANILMTGETGSGKSQSAILAAKSIGRELFSFNLGSTGDPRATLIGNTTFNKETGTLFAKSAFIEAIQTPDAVILLDEITRAHPDAWNILMTVLDKGQRYVRLDEAPGAPIVNIHPTVCFIATANIGSEYTSTRVIDRALLDRFTIIEMEYLNSEEESKFLTKMFPNLNKDLVNNIANTAYETRIQKETGRLSTAVSTRTSVEICELLSDGFTFSEVAEIAIYPLFDKDGGVDSERTFVKQLVQRYGITE